LEVFTIYLCVCVCVCVCVCECVCLCQLNPQLNDHSVLISSS